MQFLLNLHHVVYVPIIVFTATVAMAWMIALMGAVMERPAGRPAQKFRPVVISGGRAATLRVPQIPLRSGARAAQPYRASFGG